MPRFIYLSDSTFINLDNVTDITVFPKSIHVRYVGDNSYHSYSIGATPTKDIIDKINGADVLTSISQINQEVYALFKSDDDVNLRKVSYLGTHADGNITSIYLSHGYYTECELMSNYIGTFTRSELIDKQDELGIDMDNIKIFD